MLARPAPDYRAAVRGLRRYLVVPQVSKHRVFAWLDRLQLASHQLTVIARDDDYAMGVASSTPHVLWSLQQGTQLESRPRYTPSTTFQTFPLPWCPGAEPISPKNNGHAIHLAISTAAAELDKLREAWLNPPEWIAEVEKKVDITYRTQLAAVPADVRLWSAAPPSWPKPRMTRGSRPAPSPTSTTSAPPGCALAHEQLDRAVLAAYAAVDPKGGWDPGVGEGV